MPDYKNTPEGLVKLRKQLISKLTPLLLIAVIGGVAISYFNNDKKDGPLAWLVMLVLMLIFLVYSLAKGIKMQKGLYESYVLTIDEDRLSRRQTNSPELTILFSKISTISEDKTGNLIVTDVDQNKIVISSYVQGYERIEVLLQSIKPISPAISKNFLQKYPLLSPVITIGLMAAVYLSNNKIVVGLCGTVLIGGMIWAFYKIRTSVQVDSRIKRSAFWMLVVIASIAAIIYYKVFRI
jgi:uncharacterized membrane protein YhaH (DUF805 family)